ncbi:MAG: hypothetical protein IPJ80_03220 [Saprospiraceae bacterium]|nr:hypothetical protein [Saprospiraceae bacterium]
MKQPKEGQKNEVASNEIDKKALQKQFRNIPSSDYCTKPNSAQLRFGSGFDRS